MEIFKLNRPCEKLDFMDALRDGNSRPIEGVICLYTGELIYWKPTSGQVHPVNYKLGKFWVEYSRANFKYSDIKYISTDFGTVEFNPQTTEEH